MRWGKIEGHDSVRQQNIIERAGVALWSRGSWRASYSKPSDDIHDVILGDAPRHGCASLTLCIAPPPGPASESAAQAASFIFENGSPRRETVP
jgi:hypothetical protein